MTREKDIANMTQVVLQPMPQFIDVFAGAGGLSLGLLRAGWQGLFAIEKSSMAFETLRFNLIDSQSEPRFAWPNWLRRQPIDVETLITSYRPHLEALRNLPLLAGGPPCQGYSRAGRRDVDDERNRLVDKYLELVDIIEPRIILLENVTGFAEDFESAGNNQEQNEFLPEVSESQFNADHELKHALNQKGYRSFVRHALKAKDYGVPQLRPRYIHVAVKTRGFRTQLAFDPLDQLEASRRGFLAERNLRYEREVTLEEAISDLLASNPSVTCVEPRMKRFKQGKYGEIQSEYQRLVRTNRAGTVIPSGDIADSHRFVNHEKRIIERNQQIQAECRPGLQLSDEKIQSLGLNKHRIAFLSAARPCHTLTSLPDDMIHYQEPRVLTVREYARIQSFPDWFEFKSNYTSGGKRRKTEIPRYTQVANAVPPLLAEALGEMLMRVYASLNAVNVECPTEAM